MDSLRLVEQELFLDNTTLFDASFLTCEAAEVVEFSATNLTVFVDYDRVDERRFDGEDALNADVVAHFANGEAFLCAFARDADNNTAILLNTLFVTFFDSISDCDGVAGTEFGELFAGSKSLFGNFN